MPAGLQVFSAVGNKVFDSEWGNARILGSFVANTASGSKTITTVDSAVRGTLFAYRVPFIQMGLGISNASVSNKVVADGNVITWTNLSGLPVTIVYGDAYK